MPAIPPDAGITEPVPEPPEYPSPRIVDSRRLMGPNVYDSDEGALVEVNIGDVDEAKRVALLELWRMETETLCWHVGWSTFDITIERSDDASGEVRLFLPAPVDGLMSATELVEQAWVRAEQRLLHAPDERPDPQAVVEKMLAAVAGERAAHPHFVDVHDTARSREITVTFDDEIVSLGSGAGSLQWPLAALPRATAIAWDTIRDVPVSLVTGSNGKTTTTRLVAAMWRRAGKTVGFSCSDGVWVNGVQLDSGDYSGPAGAREVLRDVRVEAAVLETARGGMLRRGLAVHRATAGIITNIAADHFGEYGINSLADLARAKFVLRHALYGGGELVLNADDETLVAMTPTMEVRPAWFSMRPSPPMLSEHLLNGGNAAVLRDGQVMLHHGKSWHEVGDVESMPLTLGGAALHNIANILGASLLAAVSGVPIDAIRETLAYFGASPSDNPGRLQVQRFGGLTVLVDYAHNPDGLAALCTTALAFPATRRLLILGQAGNRDDSQLRALADAALNVSTFDRVIIKEMERMLRGRTLGEMPRVFRDALLEYGVPDASVEVAPTELDAVRRAFEWAREGDVVVCPVHIEKQAVLALLARLRATGWTPGMPLPE